MYQPNPATMSNAHNAYKGEQIWKPINSQSKLYEK